MRVYFKIVVTLCILTQLSGCVGSASNSALELRSSHLNPNEKLLPQVTVSNLEGDDFTLPKDLPSEYSILAFGFAHAQQEAINTWVPELKDIEKKNSSVRFYEVPVIDSSKAALRAIIRNGMRTGISDTEDRKRTMTLFVDKQAFIQALGVKDQEQIALMLVDRNGKVLWETAGSLEQAKLSSLSQKLSEITHSLKLPVS